MTSKIEKLLNDATGIKQKSKESTDDYRERLCLAVQKLPDETWEGLPEAAQQWVNDAAKATNEDEEMPDFPDATDDKTDKKSKSKAKDDDETEDEADETDGAEDEAEEEDDDEAGEGDDAESEDEDADEDDEEETTRPAAGKKKESKPVKTAKKKAKSKDKDDEKPAKPAKKAAKVATKKPAKEGGKERAAPKMTGVKVRIKDMILKRPTITAAEIIEKLSKDGGAKPSDLTVGSIRAEFRHSLHFLNARGVTDIKL